MADSHSFLKPYLLFFFFLALATPTPAMTITHTTKTITNGMIGEVSPVFAAVVFLVLELFVEDVVDVVDLPVEFTVKVIFFT